MAKELKDEVTGTAIIGIKVAAAVIKEENIKPYSRMFYTMIRACVSASASRKMNDYPGKEGVTDSFFNSVADKARQFISCPHVISELMGIKS